MKRTYLPAWLGLLCLLGSAPSGKAGSFTADFNNGQVPAGASVYGNSGDNASGVVEATGGFENTGCLKLTKAVGSKQGSMIISDLDGGQSVNSFTANFKIRIGGGTATPADGCSFCFANDLPDGTFGEEGAGLGLRVGFDIYNNAGEAPSFRIFWGGVQVATSGVVPIADLVTGNNFVDVQVTVAPTGAFSLSYNGRAIMTNRNIGFQPIAGGRFGFGGRTGGANANQFIDNVSISTSLGDTLLPGIVQAPLSQVVVSGYPALMNVVAFDPVNSTYQWESKAPRRHAVPARRRRYGCALHPRTPDRCGHGDGIPRGRFQSVRRERDLGSGIGRGGRSPSRHPEYGGLRFQRRERPSSNRYLR